jgi:hypothetical protein
VLKQVRAALAPEAVHWDIMTLRIADCGFRSGFRWRIHDCGWQLRSPIAECRERLQ